MTNISRTIAKQEIDERSFFKLGHFIRILAEGNLLFSRNSAELVGNLVVATDNKKSVTLRSGYSVRYGNRSKTPE